MFYLEPLQDTDLQRTAVMVLGAVASTYVETGHHQTAESIVNQLEDALGIHGKNTNRERLSRTCAGLKHLKPIEIVPN